MLSDAEQVRLALRGKQDPVWWVRDVLGDEPWGAQCEILESVRDNEETAVKSCHGPGKSWIAARCVLWFLYNHVPSIVITTAPTDRQVKGILWKEIRVAHAKAIGKLGGVCLTQELKIEPDWWAWGFTAPSYDPDRFQGFHEANILVVIEEASGVSQQIYDAIDSVMSSQNARKLEIGNPTDPSSAFARSFKTKGIAKHTISAFDTPNFTHFGITEEDIASGKWEKKIKGELPAPKLVTPKWVAKRYERWGPESSLYVSRVKAEFPQEGTDTLIPLAWIEAAQRRHLKPSTPHELGVDVARFGNDLGAIAHRRGRYVRIIDRIRKADTMHTTGRVVKALDDTKADRAKVDVIGIGAGVVDRLGELEKPVIPANASAAAEDGEKFKNARAEWFWGLRERFELDKEDPKKGRIDIDEADEDLAAQLASIKYKFDSSGRIQIESKEEMKKRGLRSPDDADAVAIAFAKISDHMDSGVEVDPDVGYTGNRWDP